MAKTYCAACESCWLKKNSAGTITSRITLGQGDGSGFEVCENEQTQRAEMQMNSHYRLAR